MKPQLNSRIKFFLPLKRDILALFLFAAFSSAFYLAGPYFSKLFIDRVFLKRDAAAFFKFSAIGAGVFLFSVFFKALGDAFKNRAIVRAKLNLAAKFIRKLYALDLAFFQRKSVGENIYRLGDTERIARLILERLPQAAVDAGKLLIVSAIAFRMEARLSALFVLFSPLFLLQGIFIRRRLRRIYEEIWKSGAKLFKEAGEAFARMAVIKAFGWEAHQRRRYLRRLLDNLRLAVAGLRWSTFNSVASTFFSRAVFGALSLYGGWLIIQGKMSLGSYSAVMLYLTQAGALIVSLVSAWEYFLQESVILVKFFEVMETQPRIKNLPGAIRLGRIKGEIVFQDASFSYAEGSPPVLRNLSLKMLAGKWLAIVGPSGSGKTTLVNLILRLYEPLAGKIYLDGCDLRQADLSSLRERVAVATQEPLLFDLSLRENIAYGLSAVAAQRVEEAARLAQLQGLIKELPAGLNTLVGENGCQLAQGQKQRLALARAILREADVLILDEATASVDSETEERILRQLRLHRQGRTTLVISHRLSAIKDAERIYFLTAAGLQAEGAHSALLDSCSAYRDFFQNQI